MALVIELLARAHRPLLTDFENPHASLVQYLRRFALRHAERDLLARTFVAIDVVGEQRRIAGYFSLATTSVDRASAEPVSSLGALPRFPIPGVLLARLAVDARAMGQGLGRYLFEEALGRTLAAARAGPLAFRVLVTDAIDESAAQFYEHFGLTRLAAEAPCRMVLDLSPVLSGK